jgi:sulfate permease, SulP family
VCIDAVAISDLDYSAGQMLCELQRKLEHSGISLVFAEVTDAVRAQLDRHGVTALIGEGAFFDTLDAAIAAFRGHDVTAR